MKRVAIIENEYQLFRGMFEILNFKYYQNLLQYENFPNVESIDPIEQFQDYDLVIVDVNLSPRSPVDGIDIVERLKTLQRVPPIVIFTGYSKTEEKLLKRDLPEYDIIVKPATYDKVFETMSKYIPRSQSPTITTTTP